ncbi:MAG: histidine phosphatase family protein [Methylococcaceae bacterium]|nr:histidine phosphatase family protein [Methylococcaceae bacterium]MCI0733648.1 histidine phosphatase family protein [Methylococcaceae bacterium]
MSKKTRHLMLLRHAKSSWKSDAESDFDRPLAKRGKLDAARAGSWLRRQKLIPDLILSSPAQRARRTISKACRELSFDEDEIRWVPEIYDASLNDLVKILKACPDKAKTVLMVGHNPGLEYLLEYLCREPLPVAEDGKLLTAGCIAHLEVPGKWSAVTKSTARLLSITRPTEME